MGLRRNVKKVMADVQDLKLTLAPSVVYKAEKYDEISKILPNVDLKVDKIVTFVDKNGNKGLKIFYKTSPVILQMDDEEEDLIYDKKFYAINYLNLISLEDMQKISKEIEGILK